MTSNDCIITFIHFSLFLFWEKATTTQLASLKNRHSVYFLDCHHRWRSHKRRQWNEIVRRSDVEDHPNKLMYKHLKGGAPRLCRMDAWLTCGLLELRGHSWVEGRRFTQVRFTTSCFAIIIVHNAASEKTLLSMRLPRVDRSIFKMSRIKPKQKKQFTLFQLLNKSFGRTKSIPTRR